MMDDIYLTKQAGEWFEREVKSQLLTMAYTDYGGA